MLKLEFFQTSYHIILHNILYCVAQNCFDFYLVWGNRSWRKNILKSMDSRRRGRLEYEPIDLEKVGRKRRKVGIREAEYVSTSGENFVDFRTVSPCVNMRWIFRDRLRKKRMQQGSWHGMLPSILLYRAYASSPETRKMHAIRVFERSVEIAKWSGVADATATASPKSHCECCRLLLHILLWW